MVENLRFTILTVAAILAVVLGGIIAIESIHGPSYLDAQSTATGFCELHGGVKVIHYERETLLFESGYEAECKDGSTTE